ncbi:MAG: c-type cytochrome [Methylobacterium sp.]|uniref:c-type cytochrome n=1 Tax=Methylobacterium sp. TaxID=409 RepID=UPI0027157807|nr:c-type cytochrome [Methylobacterium sp.]MDO9427022.1 c-type cytochrome [Methylobacterium sp.]
MRRLRFVRSVLGVFGLLAVPLVTPPALAQMRGHGGPVRALAVVPGGEIAISGGFDQAVIVWGIANGTALSVLRFHEGAVNAVATLPDGGFATASEDGRIALWRIGRPEPERTFAEHTGPLAGLAVSPDGLSLASASWDGTARVRPLAGGPARVLAGHAGPVNAVAFLPDGRIATAGYDATLRIWPTEDAPPRVTTLPTPLNALAVTREGEIAVAGGDAIVRFLRPDGSERTASEVEPNPVIALALSPDETRLAAATAGGTVAVIDRATGAILRRLVGPGLPVWSVAWRGDELVTGGSDRLVRRWNAMTGEPIGALSLPRPADTLATFHGDRGAEVYRACVACHALRPEDGPRAGPNLAGIIGRRIASEPGYRYSEALKSMDLVWDAAAIARLFEVGPARYTPGTRMPEQTINTAEDREALVRFLEKATALP